MDGSTRSYELPYHVSIPGGLYPDRVITVSGIVLHEARRFEINLCTERDIAFHFNPRFDENTVVRNSQINGTWGTEERNLPFHMPFKRGYSFKVEIICEASCYNVSVDDHQLLQFNHRLKDLPTINHLEVKGDIKLNSVVV